MAINEQLQEELRYNKYVKYVSNTTIKFSDELIDAIKSECKSSSDIRDTLSKFGIPEQVFTKGRIKRLYMVYVSKAHTTKGLRLMTIKFNDEQIKQLEELDVVIKASASVITFTPEFRCEVARAKNLPAARKIFTKHNVSLELLGEKRISNSYYRFKDKYNKEGEAAFIGEKRGRKVTTQSASYQGLSDSEKVDVLEKQLAKAQEDVEFLKKYTASSREPNVTPKSLYSEIYKDVRGGAQLNLRRLFINLNLNESGYYRYIKTLNSYKIRQDKLIVKVIKMYMKKHNNTKGYRQIKMHLDDIHNRLKFVGFPLVNHKRIQRLMRENSIECKIRCKSPHRKIWKATKEDKVSPNILMRGFTTGVPFQKLLTDITYLQYIGDTAYLSAVKDCITGEIIAYTVRNDLGLQLSLEILDQIEELDLAQDALIHSDQGVHYTSKKFRSKVKEINIIQSMSRRGNCIDNACMETFFGHMKDEIKVKIKKCETFEEVQQIVNQYMIYYNKQRKQWNKKKMTPVQYRNHILENLTA